jgi:hypothetical protein
MTGRFLVTFLGTALNKTAKNVQLLQIHPEDGNCNVYRNVG